MRIKYKIPFLILLFTTIISCKNIETKETQLNEKEFGLWNSQSDSLSVELKFNIFNNWKELVERTERIVCNDSLPKITIQNNKEVKSIYFHNPCWDNFACILIKQKNTIEIHNDTITKNDKLFPLDSLDSVLRRDLENNGKNPMWSENPEKLLIYISYDNKKFKNFILTLDKLTQSYKNITNNNDINIILNEKFDIPPPPPFPEKVN